MLITDNEILISAAKRNYDHFKVPTGSVQSIKTKRKYLPSDLADLDIKTSCNLIGEIVNCSQELNTIIWDTYNKNGNLDEVMQIYYDASLLDVLSNVEIDRAKREFTVDSKAEIKAIRQKYQQRDEKGRQVKPNFFGHVARTKGFYDSSKKNYKQHKTTMDFLQHCLNVNRLTTVPRNIIPFSQIIKDDAKFNRVNYDSVHRVLDVVREARYNIRQIWAAPEDEFSKEQKAIMAAEVTQDVVNYIGDIQMSAATMRKLLLSIEEPKNRDISRTIFFTLFGSSNASFYAALKASGTNTAVAQPQEDGDFEIYGIQFAHCS